MESLHAEILNLALILLTGLVGYVAKHVASYFKKKGILSQIESHKELAKLVVAGVEQAYTQLHGKEKLNVAKIELIKLANSKGLKVSEKELDIIIEAVVKEMNDSIKEVK